MTNLSDLFCEDHVPLDGMVGGPRVVTETQRRDIFFTHTSSSHKFGEKYGKGVTIGCGVNFKKETAFFTRNGELIDEWAQFDPHDRVRS
jgi:Ran-binding protein 9/10